MNISRTDHDFSMKWRKFSNCVLRNTLSEVINFNINTNIKSEIDIHIIFPVPCVSESCCINNTHREKLCFYSIQYKNVCLAASDLFNMFTQSIKFFAFHYHVLKSRDVCMVHQIDSKNEWLLLPASFTAKFGLVFVLTWKTLFLRGFILKPTERA